MSFPEIHFNSNNSDRVELARELLRNINSQLDNALGGTKKDFVTKDGCYLSLAESVVVDKKAADKLIITNVVDRNITYNGRKARLLKGTYGNRDVYVYSFDFVSDDGRVINVRHVKDALGENIDLDIFYSINGIDTDILGKTVHRVEMRLNHDLYLYLKGLIDGFISGDFLNNQFSDYREGEDYDEWLNEALEKYLGTIKVSDLLLLCNQANNGKMTYGLSKMIDIDKPLGNSGKTGTVTRGRVSSIVNDNLNPFLAIGLCGAELVDKWEVGKDMYIYPFEYNNTRLGVNYNTGELFRRKKDGSYVPYYNNYPASIYELLFRHHKIPLVDFFDTLEGTTGNSLLDKKLKEVEKNPTYQKIYSRIK